MPKQTLEDQRRAALLGRIVRQLREEAGLNRPDFVSAMKKYPGGEIRPDYLNKLERGARSLASASPGVREAVRLVSDVTPEDWQALTGLYVPADAPLPAHPRRVGWLFEALGITRPVESPTGVTGALYVEHTDRISVPVRGLSAAGTAFYAESNRVGTITLQPKDYDRTHEIVRVCGDSMAPTLRDGDHVAVDPHDLTLIEGRIYVFHILGDGHTLKRVKRLADGNLWMVSDNPAYPPMRPEEVEVRGRAVKRYPQTEAL